MCHCHRGDLPETGTRWSGRVEGRSQSHSEEYPPPKPNITKEEQKAIEKLRKDDTRIVLTVHKGVALVVMNKEDYEKKEEELLTQTTYNNITNDPTTRYKNKLINLLKIIKTQGGISGALYKKLYPTGAGVPKFYGLPKIHKKETPLRPIVFSMGSVSHATSKELARTLKPLVGRSPYHIHNNQDLLEDLKSLKLEKDECLMSFDVQALFTSVPIQPAIQIIKKLLEDQDLKQRTSMSVDHIVCLLEFCLRSTYFTLKAGSMNNKKVQLWALPSAQLLQTCIWRTWKPRPYSLHKTHHHFGED